MRVAIRGKHAVKTGQIDPGPWRQCGQTGNEIQRFEDDVSGADTTGRL